MTVGEKIKKYRKDLGLSQEELSQKLLVSRQTISQWEKDQTVPTIDNLIRLSDIFSTSVDELLDSENKNQYTEIQPNETYRFTFTKEELNEINRLQRKSIYKKPILFALICIFLVGLFIGTSAPDIMIGFASGVFLISSVANIKSITAYNKAWKNTINRICESTYEHNLFENCLEIIIYHKNEMVRKTKCYYTDIEKIQSFDKWFFLQFSGQLFIIRKSELKENSVFYSYMYKNPANSAEDYVSNKWRSASVVLFNASLFSIFAALALVGAISDENNFFENMWLFFLLTPIPIASIVLGFILKSKGFKYKKNIIVGIIIAALLCIYGSFPFIFENEYHHIDESVIITEQTEEFDIPEHK